MNTDRSQALFFLMSLGALPACVVGDDGDTDASTDPTSGTAPTTGVDTSGTMTSTTMSTSGDPTGDVTGDTSTATDPDTGTTDPDTGTGTSGGYNCGTVPEVCNTFGDKYAECYPRYAQYAEEAANICACAIYTGDDYGANCATAYNDLYACLSGLSCEEFMSRTACATEAAALETECAGGGTTTGG